MNTAVVKDSETCEKMAALAAYAVNVINDLIWDRTLRLRSLPANYSYF